MPVAVRGEDLQHHLELEQDLGADRRSQAAPPRQQRQVDRVQALVAEIGDGELVGAHEVVLPESVLDGDAVPAQLHHDSRAVGHQDPGSDVELDRLAHAVTTSDWCTMIRVAWAIGASRSQSICPLQMPCHIADTTCPPPASSSRTSATVP